MLTHAKRRSALTVTRQDTKHPPARTLRYAHYATTATTKPETAPTPGTDQRQYALPVTNDQPVDVEGIKSPPHPSTCDLNFSSVLSDDDGPYASTTEDQDITRQDEQASATLDIPQQQQQQQQQLLQTPPPATPLQDTGKNSKGNTSDISDTSPEPHTPAITTPNPTDLTTPSLEKQETTTQDINSVLVNKDQLGVQKILSVCPMEHLNRYIYVNHHDLTAKYLYYLPRVLS